RLTRAGRKPRLTANQAKALIKKLLAGPEKLGYHTPLWTCPRVADQIEQLFGIQYHPGHVWKLLRSLGWSVQRPTTQARERNESAIAEWKQVTWSEAKKSPRTRPYYCLHRRKWADGETASLL
ncbi:MAG: winged helix-turn-helix domain-containing protein, partial [Acidobacteriota bacterium]